MPNPTPQQVWDDSEFWDDSKLKDPDRHQVISSIDPDYAKLSPQDQSSVMGEMRKRWMGKVSPNLPPPPKVPLPGELGGFGDHPRAAKPPVPPNFRLPTAEEETKFLQDTGSSTGGSQVGLEKLKAGAKNLLGYRNRPQEVNVKRAAADIGEGALDLAGQAGPFSIPGSQVAGSATKLARAVAAPFVGIKAAEAANEVAPHVGITDPDTRRLVSLGTGLATGAAAHATVPRAIEAVRKAPLQNLPNLQLELTPKRTGFKNVEEMAQKGTQMPMPITEPNEIHGPTPSGEVPAHPPEWNPTRTEVTPNSGEQLSLPSGEGGAPVQPPFNPEAWKSSLTDRLSEINKKLTDKKLPADDRQQLTNEKRAIAKTLKELPEALPEPSAPAGEQLGLGFDDSAGEGTTIPEVQVTEPEVPTPTQTAKQGVLWTSGEIPQTKQIPILERKYEAIGKEGRPDATSLARKYINLEEMLKTPDQLTPDAINQAQVAMNDIAQAIGKEAINKVRGGEKVGVWQETGLREGMRRMSEERGIRSSSEAPTPETPGSKLESIFNAKPTEPTLGEKVEALYHRYIFRGRIPKTPAGNRIVNDLRKMKDSMVDASQYSNTKLRNVVEPIYKAFEGDKTGMDNAYRQLGEIVNIEAWIDGAEQKGQTLPGGTTLEGLKYRLEDLKKTAPISVLEAAERHKELGKELGQMLADRGKISQDVVNDPYFPRQYIDWVQSKQSDALYLKKMRSMKLDAPERLYAKEKLGSENTPYTDYLDVMDRHIKQIMLDNAMDDTIGKIVKENDLYPKLSKANRDSLHKQWASTDGPQPGMKYKLEDGTIVKAYEATVPPEYKTGTPLGDAIVAAFPEIREGNQRTAILPVEIADHLSNFRTLKVPNSVLRVINQATSQWKRGTLAYSGLKFITKQIPDNYLVAYREHDLIETVRKSSEAWDIISGKADGGEPGVLTQDRLRKLQLLQEQRVFSGPSSVFSGELSGHHGNLPKELSVLQGENQFFRKVSYIANVMESVGDQHARVAKFLADLERIDRGESPQTTTVDIRGLDPIDAAGKIAREAFIDNGAKSDIFQQQVSSFALPFVWWAVKSIPQWGRYFVDGRSWEGPLSNPIMRFGVPYAMMQVWNNTVTKEQEKQHADWLRMFPHLNTLWKTKDGKNITISLDSGLGVLMRALGADRAGMLLSKVHNDEISAQQALQELVTAAPKGLGGIVWSQLNPMLKLTFDLAAGKNLDTGRKIVSDQDSEDMKTEKRLKYAGGQLVAPVGKMQNEFGKPTDTFIGQENLPAGARQWVGAAGRAMASPFNIYSGFTREEDPLKAQESKWRDTVSQVKDRGKETMEAVQAPYIDAMANAYANLFDPSKPNPNLQAAQVSAAKKVSDEIGRRNRVIEMANKDIPAASKTPLISSAEVHQAIQAPGVLRQIITQAIPRAANPQIQKALQTYLSELAYKAEVEGYRNLSPGVQGVVPAPPDIRVPKK